MHFISNLNHYVLTFPPRVMVERVDLHRVHRLPVVAAGQDDLLVGPALPVPRHAAGDVNPPCGPILDNVWGSPKLDESTMTMAHGFW